jgi:hypothetical protein
MLMGQKRLPACPGRGERGGPVRARGPAVAAMIKAASPAEAGEESPEREGVG